MPRFTKQGHGTAHHRGSIHKRVEVLKPGLFDIVYFRGTRKLRLIRVRPVRHGRARPSGS